MKYKCGMYGGSFNPLHMGHVGCIVTASCQCERLIIVISNGLNRDEIDVRLRYRWIYQMTKHASNVDIFILDDHARSKESYCKENWLDDAAKVKEFAGENIDAVFCGSDYDKNSFWAQCYPSAELIILPRNDISSTEIRKAPLLHWDWLPNVVKPHYVKKVLLIGGESTGKSTLTINLSNYFNTNCLEEVGRDISERSGTDLLMIPEDFTDILLQHKTREIEAVKYSNRVLFEDTDCLTTLFYLRFLNSLDKDRNESLASAIAGFNKYDLILFLEPDVTFIHEGDRSEIIAADREKYSEQIKEIYTRYGYDFVTLNGDYFSRFNRALELINQLMTGGVHYDSL